MSNHTSAPKSVLCIHDLSGVGRSSLSVILPVLAVMGLQPVALPTAVLSSHTGGLGQPAMMAGGNYGPAALAHYRQLGLHFDCIYSGYLGNVSQLALVRQASEFWPNARLVVDPVLGDGGKPYRGIGPELVRGMRELCRQADLILPNLTESALLLETELPAGPYTRAEATDLADRVAVAMGANTVITGLPMDRFLGCAGGGKESFVVQNARLPRSFPGTGDMFAAVTVGCLLRGNVLSAATETAAAFVSSCIAATPPEADTRYGVWFEPQLGHLLPAP